MILCKILVLRTQQETNINVNTENQYVSLIKRKLQNDFCTLIYFQNYICHYPHYYLSFQKFEIKGIVKEISKMMGRYLMCSTSLIDLFQVNLKGHEIFKKGKCIRKLFQLNFLDIYLWCIMLFLCYFYNVSRTVTFKKILFVIFIFLLKINGTYQFKRR